MNSKLIIILFAIAIVIFFIIQSKRTKQIKQRENLQMAALLSRQEAVLKELDTIGNLIHDKSLTNAEIISKAKVSFAILDGNNIDGKFTEIIEDVKQYFSSETGNIDASKSRRAISFLRTKSPELPVARAFSIDSLTKAEVDPLAEAEVYLAYGRREQALKILEEALDHNPSRKDIKARLDKLKGREGVSADLASLEESEQHLPNLQAQPKSHITRKFLLILVLVCLILIGAFLHTILGGFMFAYATQYYHASKWMSYILFPLFWFFWFRSDKINFSLQMRCPTKWVRCLIYPLMALLSIFTLFVAPLGWMALYVWVAGTQINNVPAQIISVGQYHPSSKGCDQSASLALNGIVDRICLSNRLFGHVPKAGETVSVIAQTSSPGIYIVEVHSD